MEGGVSTWTRVSVRVPAESVGIVEDCLLECGALSVTLLAADGQELFAEHGGDSPLWNHCAVEGLFESGDVLPRLASVLGGCCPEAEIVPHEALTDRDWEAQYRQYAVDETFAGRLRLAPRSAVIASPPVITLRLDPGMAFGTGSHPTTRLCLEWIASRHLQGARVLDFGCGSGVLAIAMAMLGAAQVDAVDIDPQAVQATRENAAFNGLDAGGASTAFRVYETAAFKPRAGTYDVVMANILLNPLIGLAPLLVSCLGPRAVLVLSGVLAGQRQALFEAYPAIRFAEPVIDDGWLLAEGWRRG
jgi:ribosomal protein L11 methyltransferase